MEVESDEKVDVVAELVWVTEDVVVDCEPEPNAQAEPEAVTWLPLCVPVGLELDNALDGWG